MFSEAWLEKHGNALFQDYWVTKELDGALSDRQENLLDSYINKIKAASKEVGWLLYLDQDIN